MSDLNKVNIGYFTLACLGDANDRNIDLVKSLELLDKNSKVEDIKDVFLSHDNSNFYPIFSGEVKYDGNNINEKEILKNITNMLFDKNSFLYQNNYNENVYKYSFNDINNDDIQYSIEFFDKIVFSLIGLVDVCIIGEKFFIIKDKKISGVEDNTVNSYIKMLSE